MTAAAIFVAVAIIVAYPFNILPARVTLKLIWDRLQTTKLGLRFRILSRYFHGNHRSRSSSSDNASNSQSLDNDEEGNDGLEPLLFGDTSEQSSHLPPLSLSNDTIHNNSHSDPTTSTMEHFLLTLILSGSALIVALLIPGISVVFGLMGGTAASVISFILPGLFLKEMDERHEGEEGAEERRTMRNRKFIARAFVLGGVVIGVLSTGVTLYGLL
jgi:hypothetical protein